MEKWGVVFGAWFVVLGWKTRKRLRRFTVHGSRLEDADEVKRFHGWERGEERGQRSEIRCQQEKTKHQAHSLTFRILNFCHLKFVSNFVLRISNFSVPLPLLFPPTPCPLSSATLCPMPFASPHPPSALSQPRTKHKEPRTKNREARVIFSFS